MELLETVPVRIGRNREYLENEKAQQPYATSKTRRKLQLEQLLRLPVPWYRKKPQQAGSEDTKSIRNYLFRIRIRL